MAFMRNINDFILTLVALSLPSIAATIDCNGKPFHCLNSTHFMICVDFGSGVSSTMDDFVIPCPPTTVCQATNRFECEFPTVTTTTVTPVVTDSPLVVTPNNNVVIDDMDDVTTIPFKEFFNTISTTTSDSNLITRDAVTTENPMNNLSENFNVPPATDSNNNETVLNDGVSPDYFTTLATLNIVTEETTVTELIPKVAEDVNVTFEPNSNISEAFLNATEIVSIDSGLINLSENNTYVTENYESNSTLLETIIGATNFREFNTSLYNSTAYEVTEPILSEATESTISIPIDDKQFDLTTLDASLNVVLDNKTTEKITVSVQMKITEHKDFQSNSTFNEIMSSGGIIHNDPKISNTALGTTNGLAINANNSDLSFNNITTKYEEQKSTGEPILFTAKENRRDIFDDDKKVSLTTLDVSSNDKVDDQIIDQAMESIPAQTTEYKNLIVSQSNQFNNKPVYHLTSYDVTQPILSDVTESAITILVHDEQAYMSTLEASPDVVPDDQTINNVTENIAVETTDYKHLVEPQIGAKFNETVSGGDIVQNYTTKLQTVLNTNKSLDVNNSDLYFLEITTKYDEQIRSPETILYKAKENTKDLNDKQANLTTLGVSSELILDNNTIPKESLPTETTKYRRLETFENKIFKNQLNNSESALKMHESNSDLNENNMTYEQQISTAQNNLEPSNDTGTEITEPDLIETPSITQSKLSVPTITTANSELIPTNVTNAAIDIDAVGEETDFFYIIESGNKTNIFEDKQTSNLKIKDSNHYLTSTENSVLLDNTSVGSENITNITQSENLTSINYVENVAKTLTKNEELHLLLPKPSRSNVTITVIQSNSTVDNTSMTNSIPNKFDTNISKNKTVLNEISTRTDEAQRFLTSEVNLSDKTAEAFENNHLLQPMTEPTNTSFPNIAHNVSGSALANEYPQETSTFINRTKLTLTGNVTKKSLTQNMNDSEMNNITHINVTPSKHIEFNNQVNVLRVGDESYTVKIPVNTTNNNLETATQEVESLTYSNVYYQTDIEEVTHDQGIPRNNTLSVDMTESTSSILVFTTERPKETYSDAILQTTTSFNSVSEKVYTAEVDTYLTSTTNSPQHDTTNDESYVGKEPTTDIINLLQPTAITLTIHKNSAIDTTKQVMATGPSLLLTPLTINGTSYDAVQQNIPSAEVTTEPADFISDRFKYTTTTETANDPVHQESLITITTDSATTKPFESSTLSYQTKRDLKETVLEITASSTATDSSAIPISTEPNLSDVTDFRKEINSITVLDTLTIETTVDVMNKASTDNVLEKDTITNRKEHTDPRKINEFLKTTSDNITFTTETEKMPTGSSLLLYPLTINETSYGALQQNMPSTEVTNELPDFISDQFKYTSTTETANDSAHQESLTTITSDLATTKPFESSALSNQTKRNLKETLPEILTSNTATDSSAIPISKVSNLSGATYFGEDINGITVLDSLNNETSIEVVNKASTDDIMEKTPITIRQENIDPRKIKGFLKTNTTLSDINVTTDTKHLESSNSYSIQRKNIDKLEIAPVNLVDINYTKNQTQNGSLSNGQPIPKILLGPYSSVNKSIFVDGLTLNDTAVMTRDEIKQKSTNNSLTPKTSTKEILLKDTLQEKGFIQSIVKTPESNDDINANPIVTTETSTFESQSERKLSVTYSIQESKYLSNPASSTESWQATVATKPIVNPTRPYVKTSITSSKPNTDINEQMSQDLTTATPISFLADPHEKHYINLPQTTEDTGEAMHVPSSLEPSIIFPQATETSGIMNHDGQSSRVPESMTQKSQGINTFKFTQKQGGSSTEKYFVNLTPPASSSIISKPADLSTGQSFASHNKNFPQHSEQIKVPNTEQLKINILQIISHNTNVNKPVLNTTALPILKHSNNMSKANGESFKIKAISSSNSNVGSEPKREFTKVLLQSTTAKIRTQNSDPDFVMIDVVKTDSASLGKFATSSNNTHSGILALPKSTSQQVQKHKASKSVAENERETEIEEKPEVKESSASNGQKEQLTPTKGIPIKKQANVQQNPSVHTKQEPVENVTTRPIGFHVVNTTARYNTKTKSFANIRNSTHPASETSKHNFVCKLNKRGRFSDSGDCRRFYVCIGKHEPIKGICPNNTVFSELRKQCTKNLSHCVRNNQFQCVSEGRFSDYLKDNIYYICVHNKANRFIRFKLQCQNGYHLNKTSVRCFMNTKSVLSTSQQSKSASDVSTSKQSISVKSEKIKEKLQTNKKFECKRSGKFPETNDRRKYYVCTKLGKSEYRQRIKKCDSDEVYDGDKKKCVDAESYERS